MLKISNALVLAAATRLAATMKVSEDDETIGEVMHRIEAPLIVQGSFEGLKDFALPTPWPAKIARRKKRR